MPQSGLTLDPDLAVGRERGTEGYNTRRRPLLRRDVLIAVVNIVASEQDLLKKYKTCDKVGVALELYEIHEYYEGPYIGDRFQVLS